MPLLSKELATGAGSIVFELDEDEYAAIGRVTAHWAYLEHCILAATVELARGLNVAIPEDSMRSSFSRRLSALGSLAERLSDEKDRRRLGRLISQIANAEQDRHKMTHGLWDWDRSDPDRLHASSFRPGFEFEKRYNAAALGNLAKRISRISFDLQYPEGWDAAFVEILKEHTDADGFTRFGSKTRRLARADKARRER